MKKICFVVTAEFSVKVFLLDHLRALSDVYSITVVVNTDNPNFLSELGVNAKVIPLSIARDISLVSDLMCLIKLIKIFYQESFVSVHSVTPKAGLLAMIASKMVRVPMRVHSFTGQVWATKVGLKRYILKKIDCLIDFLATHNLVDSPSQRQFLLNQKIIDDKKSVIFGHSSISGVDTVRFQPNLQVRASIRQQLNIPDDSIVFLFIGRLTKDKGVLDLAYAFSGLAAEHTHLVCVGPDEQNMQAAMMSIIGANSQNVHFVGHTNTPEAYMAAADVLCLPSYREGFGVVIIEAAAVGVPAIASRIYGITDAVVEGETGLLHTPHVVEAIISCMRRLMENESLRLRLGEQAIRRAIKDFDSEAITQEWVKFYQENVH